MGRTALVLVALVGCSFQPGAFRSSDDGGGPSDDGGGSGSDDASGDPDAMPMPRSCTFHLGSDHSCSVRRSDGAIFCVGLNGFGELGRGNTGGSSTSVVQVNVGATVAAASRNYHTCIARTDQTVACWGYNDSGQLGDGSKTTRDDPTTVTGLDDVVELAVARSFSCARRTDGSVTCWGGNGDGQLGDGTNSERLTPTTTVQGFVATPVAISAGSSHACARFADGTARCWGRNDYGQLGDGSQMDRNMAVLAPVTSIKQIAPSGYSTNEGMGGQTCALLTNGTVWCWGSNNFGQLGNGSTSTTPSVSAIQTNLTDAVELTMGRYHACVRHGTGGGSVSCWGRNSVGEVGDGTSDDRSTPTPVNLPRPAVHVAAGGFHTCALLDDDSVRCWGSNEYGQLADGTNGNDRLSPVASNLCP